MAKMKLYDFQISGNCYKVRLMLSLLNLDYNKINIDVINGESQTDEYKKINPRGLIPALIDGETIIWDSMAILSYLARRYGCDSWFPQDALNLASVMQWLAVSENELLYGLARARAALVFKRPFNLAQCQDDANIGLMAMDQHLAGQQWLATQTPTIADIACYPYISLAHEGEVSLEPYPNVRRWMADLEALPNWIAIDE